MLPSPPTLARHLVEGLSLCLLVSDEDLVVDAGGNDPALLAVATGPIGAVPWLAYATAVQASLVAAVAQARSQGPQQLHVTVRHPARGDVLLEVTATALGAASGSVVVQFVEPAAEDDVAAALRESQRALVSLMQSWPGFAYRCLNNEAYTTVFASEGCLEIIGVPASALVSGALQYSSLMHPDDVGPVWDQVQAALEAREPFRVEYRIVLQDGREKWMWEQGHGVFDDAGELEFLEGFVTDITPLKQAQEALRRTGRLEAVGRVAGGVAHDFNNLLTGLMGIAECIRMDAPEVEQDAHEMLELCKHGAALTRQLLTFTRGQLVERVPNDLGAIVVGLEPILRRLIPASVELDFAASPAWLVIDRSQAEQLVINLCLNARDAMQDRGGTLRVRVHQADGVVRMTVADTGVGMDEQTRARLFEPFFTTRDEGTGIGLATVKDIVTQAAGDIQVQSTPGKGSVFALSFPASAVSKSTSTALRAHGSVLLVEDDQAARHATKVMLESFGWEVRDVARAREAAVAVDEGTRFDLLLTDVHLGQDESGYDLAQRITAARPSLPVLYISGYTLDARIQASVDAGEATFLAKPFSPVALRARIAQALEAGDRR